MFEDSTLVTSVAWYVVVASALVKVLGDDMVHLVHHLLVLLQEVWVHCMILNVKFVIAVAYSVELFVCLPVFFIKQSNRRVEHYKRHVVVFLPVLSWH